MMIPFDALQAQKTAQDDYLIGRTLHDGEYRIKRLLAESEDSKLYLAVHVDLSIPLILKQVRADQPLPESVITELDYILHGGDVSHLSHLLPNGAEDRRPVSCTSPENSQTQHFSHEALLLARLHHPALPTLYAYFSEEGYWYLVMNYSSGVSLRQTLQQSQPLTAQEAIGYALQLCDALDYLHRQDPPVLFGNLTPETILIVPDHAVMLCDFTCAQYLSEETSPTSTAQTGNTAPSSYTAPELLEGQGKATPSSDLYSLGIILQEMVSRCTTHSGQVTHSTLLHGLIKLATRAEVSERFLSANTFFLALERAYRIEEHLAYQRHVCGLEMLGPLLTEKPSRPQGLPGPVRLTKPEASDDTEVVPCALDLEQRRLARESLQRLRLERLQQEQLELQLASVDESLQRRSSMSLSQLSLHSLEIPPTPAPKRMISRFTRIIQLSFVLALFLFVSMVSLLLYSRMRLSSQQQISRTTAQVLLAPTLSQPTKPAKPTEPANPSSSWLPLPPLPAPEADNAAVYLNLQGHGYVYMNGGYHGHDKPRYDHNLYRYDISAGRWEIVVHDHFPGMINNAAAVDENNNIFFTAGYSSENYTVSSLLYMYHPDTAQTTTIVPPPHIQLGFAGSLFADKRGHIYLTQGFMQAGNTHMQAGNGWYRYDIHANQWTQLANMSSGRGYLQLTSDGQGHLFTLGGSEDAGQKHQTNAIYRYDIANNSWSPSATSMPEALSGAAGCTIWPNQYVLIGGYDPLQDQGRNSTWRINLHTLQSQMLNQFTAGSSVLGAAACDGHGHAYLIRGASDPRQPTSDFWKLQSSR